MYIGKAAQLAGTSVKSIRHYEKLGLLPEPQRAGNYRIYSEQSVDRLRLIKCAQQLGFKLKEMQAILQPYPEGQIPWLQVQQALADKKAAVRAQITSLQGLHAALEAFEHETADALCTLQPETGAAAKVA